MAHKKKISLFPHERENLVKLYLKFRIPIGQYQRRPAELAQFVNEWRSLTGRSDTAGELIHYMRNQRQQGLWVRLEDKALPAPPLPRFSDEETEILVRLYKEVVIAAGEGCGVLDQEPEVAESIAKDFAALAGRVVSAHDITAKLTALRRRGTFPTVGRKISHASNQSDMGFTDIDDTLKKVDDDE